MTLTPEQHAAALQAAAREIKRRRTPKQDRDDVRQDALLHALQAVERGYVDPAHIYKWCTSHLLADDVSEDADDDRAEFVARTEATTSEDEIRRIDARLDLASILERAADVLSSRELEVLRLFAEGLEADDISQRLDISTDTVRVHKMNAIVKIRETVVNTENVDSAIYL